VTVIVSHRGAVGHAIMFGLAKFTAQLSRSTNEYTYVPQRWNCWQTDYHCV